MRRVFIVTWVSGRPFGAVKRKGMNRWFGGRLEPGGLPAQSEDGTVDGGFFDDSKVAIEEAVRRAKLKIQERKKDFERH